MEADVIADNITQFKIVFVEFPMTIDMMFYLVMHFYAFHYRINLFQVFVDYI